MRGVGLHAQEPISSGRQTLSHTRLQFTQAHAHQTTTTTNAAITLGDFSLGNTTLLSSGTGAITVGDVTLSGSTLTLGDGGNAGIQAGDIGATGSLVVNTLGGVTLGAINTSGNVTLTNTGGATLDAVTANTLTITATTGTVRVDGVVDLTTLTTAAGGYNLSLLGAVTVDSDTTFGAIGGTLSIGDAAGDSATFAGGLDTTAVTGTVRLAGTVQTTNTAMDLGPVTLAADTTLQTGSGASAGLTLGAVTSQGHGLTLDSGSSANTTVASFAGVWQPGTSFGIIEILPVAASRVPVSTRHIRQLATTDRPGCQQ